MALEQCRKFFFNYPHIRLVESFDTADVAKEIHEKKIKSIGAIASSKSAELYELNILAGNIQTANDNYTRFFVLSTDGEHSNYFNKASIKFLLPHKSGSLLNALQCFADYGINMTKIQSLPLIDKPWEYAFFADLIFESKEQFYDALAKLSLQTNEIKVFGKYFNRIIGSERLNRIGEYYFSSKLNEVRGLISEGKPIINFGIGDPDLQPPPAAIQRLKMAMDEKRHGYQPYNGLPELRNSFAGFYKSFFNVDLDPANEILPLSGSKEGIMHISLAFLNEGDQVFIPDPGYPTYTSAANIAGAIPVYYKLTEENDYRINFNELEQFDLRKVKLLWLNYPHMPTGASADLAYFHNLIDFAVRNDILVVNDNAYGLIGEDKPLSILQVNKNRDHFLELNSLSKSFNVAGWRVGMLGGDSSLIKKVLSIKSNMDSGSNYAIQQAAVEAINHGEKWIRDLNHTYSDRRKLLLKLLNKIGITPSKFNNGLFVWGNVSSLNTNGEKFSDKLLYDKNIFAVPGIVFGKNGYDYIRFSLCISQEKISEAISRF